MGCCGEVLRKCVHSYRDRYAGLAGGYIRIWTTIYHPMVEVVATAKLSLARIAQNFAGMRSLRRPPSTSSSLKPTANSYSVKVADTSGSVSFEDLP